MRWMRHFACYYVVGRTVVPISRFGRGGRQARLAQCAIQNQAPKPTMSAAVAAAAAPKTVGEAFAEPSTVKKKSGYDVPWVERYRPQTLDEVVGNEETLVRLSSIAKDGNMPNLILSGPPGTGKVRLRSLFGFGLCS